LSSVTYLYCVLNQVKMPCAFGNLQKHIKVLNVVYDFTIASKLLIKIAAGSFSTISSVRIWAALPKFLFYIQRNIVSICITMTSFECIDLQVIFSQYHYHLNIF